LSPITIQPSTYIPFQKLSKKLSTPTILNAPLKADTIELSSPNIPSAPPQMETMELPTVKKVHKLNVVINPEINKPNIILKVGTVTATSNKTPVVTLPPVVPIEQDL
jgi:hypothetical protein